MRMERAAAAVEMIHVYSLVHDDLPCMDDDDLRRGKPTVHRQYDEATALLVGDALQSQAFLILSEGALASERKVAMLSQLAQAAGSCGMCGGQAIDLDSVGVALHCPKLEQMHRMKTGALLRASVLLGALAGKSLQASEQRHWMLMQMLSGWRSRWSTIFWMPLPIRQHSERPLVKMQRRTSPRMSLYSGLRPRLLLQRSCGRMLTMLCNRSGRRQSGFGNLPI
jgi:hypothetical protein